MNRYQAGKNVGSDDEAEQLIAKSAREEGKERKVFCTGIERNGKINPDAVMENHKAREINNDWITGKALDGKIKVDKEKNGAIYATATNRAGNSEKVRIYNPAKISEKAETDGYYTVLP